MTEIVDIAEKAKLEETYFFDLDVLKRVTPEIKALVEGTFPTPFYGEDILVYEAWGMRSILESAMQLAVENKLKSLEDRLQNEVDKYVPGPQPWAKAMDALGSLKKVKEL